MDIGQRLSAQPVRGLYLLPHAIQLILELNFFNHFFFQTLKSLIENRVCVALSRARNSLFVVGNLTMLENSRTRGNGDNIWGKVTDAADEKENYRNSIELACARHPDYTKEIPVGKTPKETKEAFQMNFPEGGCVKDWLN